MPLRAGDYRAADHGHDRVFTFVYILFGVTIWLSLVKLLVNEHEDEVRGAQAGDP